MSKRILNLIIISVLSLFLCVLITNPEVCQNGTFNGILLCGRVIIPALFPFTTCVVFIINSGVCNKLRKISKITEFLTHLPAELFFIFIFSLMSGYPTGANLLNTALNNGNIKPKTAEKMLYFCVNAGPAFIISAVGCGILHSKALGVILVLSHTFSAFLLMFISNLLSPCEIDSKPIKTEEMHPVDNFINSVFIASKNVLNICSFVILFSCINAYVNFYGDKNPILKVFGLLLEVTNGVTLTENVYLISFLLGFGGISVWCQVIFSAKNIKINLPKFIIARILHGTLSSGFTFLFLKLFPQTVYTVSNYNFKGQETFYSTFAIGLSLIVMGIVLIISISTKKYVGKSFADML